MVLNLADFKNSVGEGYESCKDLLLTIGFKLEETADGRITFPVDGAVGMLPGLEINFFVREPAGD